MIHVPAWLTVLVASAVTLFGLHRVRLGLRSEQAEADATKKRGLYGMSGKRHLIYGVIYLVLGALLFAGLFGFNPLGIK